MWKDIAPFLILSFFCGREALEVSEYAMCMHLTRDCVCKSVCT